MAYNVEKLSTIELGRQGENLAKTVEIDVSSLLAQWPEATISLLCKRKHDTNPYIAVTEVRDGILLWPITSVETEIAGEGKIELRAVCGEVIAKSMTASIRVIASLTGSETEPPEAAQGWVAQVLEAGSEAEENARAAQEAADRAEDAAASAATAAEAITESARNAQEKSEAAENHANTAERLAEEAEQNAQRAEQAADTAEQATAFAAENASEAEDSRLGAEMSAQAALAEYEKASLQATSAQGSARAAEQFALDADASKTAAEQSASSAQISATNAENNAGAAARSASDVSASKQAAVESANAARESEEDAAQSAERASSFAEAAEACSEDAENAMNAADESARAASTSEENAAASAARSEAAAQAAQSIIDDETVGADKTWSSQSILDKLTVPFETQGNPVECYPVEGSPLSIVADIQPKQHFDWVHLEANTTQVTTVGRNLLRPAQGRDAGYNVTSNGITFTVNENGSVHASGTAIGTAYFNFTYYHDITLPSVTMAMGAYDGSITKDGYTWNDVTLQPYGEEMRAYIAVSGEKNRTYYPQVELGTVASSYEPYTGGKPSPSPEYPQQLTDSIPAGSYYVPSTASDGGYWCINLSEALGGLGEYKDTVEVDTFTGRYRIVRKTATGVLDGTEVWHVSGKFLLDESDWYYLSDKYASVAANKADGRIKSTTYPFAVISNNNNEGIGIGLTWRNVRIRYGNEETIDALKAKLAANPVSIRYELEQPTITTGQATLVMSTAGLTALKAVSMELTEPDPDHPCEITTPNTLKIRHCGKNLLPGSERFEKNAFVRTVSGTVDDQERFRGFPVLRTQRAWDGYKINLKQVLDEYEIPDGTWVTYSIWVRMSAIPATNVSYTFFCITDNGEPEVQLELRIPNANSNRSINVLREKASEWIRAAVAIKVDANARVATSIRFESNYYDADNYEQHTAQALFACPMLEIGEQATEFEPYQACNDYAVTLPDGFAGGEVNVTSGMAEKSKQLIILTGLELISDNGHNERIDEYCIINYTDGHKSTRKILCNCFSQDGSAAAGSVRTNSIGNPTFAVGKSMGLDTVHKFKAWLAERYERECPVAVVYDVESKTMHQTIQQSISALHGCNMLLSNTQCLAVTGRADPIKIVSVLSARLSALENAITHD